MAGEEQFPDLNPVDPDDCRRAEIAATNHCYALCIKQLNSHEGTSIPFCIYTPKLQLSYSVQRFLFTSYAFCLYLDYSILIYDHNIRNNQTRLAKYYLAHHVVMQYYKLTEAATL
ncbi:MAG: hypothetical protein M3Y53_10155 [Thermoproteota archaeon]|nr:hypothetical protein [Thermoproteota archaeon]